MKRKTVRCSQCRTLGHNKATCLNRKDKNLPGSVLRNNTATGVVPVKSGTNRVRNVHESYHGVDTANSPLKKLFSSTTLGENFTGGKTSDYSAQTLAVLWKFETQQTPRDVRGVSDPYLEYWSTVAKVLKIGKPPKEVAEVFIESRIDFLCKNFPHFIPRLVKDSSLPTGKLVQVVKAYGYESDFVQNQSKDLPLGFLKKMRKNESHVVRCAVVRHPNTPAAWVEEYVKDPHFRVRRTAAKSSKLSLETLSYLAENDGSVEVRSTALKKLEERKLNTC